MRRAAGPAQWGARTLRCTRPPRAARRALERGDLLVRQRERERGDRVVELLELGDADDRRGDAGLLQHPGERDLRAWHAARARHLGHRVDHLAIGLAGVRVERPSELVGLGARARLASQSRRAGVRAPAGSTGSRRCPGRGTAAASRALPRGRAGCSGSASRRSASSRALGDVNSALANCQAYIDDAPM